MVDGFESDPFFVSVSNLINAYNDTTRVSFFQRDITLPATYSERYDIILAFSVFVYIRPLLSLITGMTNRLLIMETHRLEDNLQSYYLDPVLQYMPHHQVLGQSEWGARAPDEGTRVIVAFARSEDDLRNLINSPMALDQA